MLDRVWSVTWKLYVALIVGVIAWKLIQHERFADWLLIALCLLIVGVFLAAFA